MNMCHYRDRIGVSFLDMYHSRKSRLAPSGFSIAKRPLQLTGFNHFWDDFPFGFSEQKASMPDDLRLLYSSINSISENMRGKEFRPSDLHFRTRQGILQGGENPRPNDPEGKATEIGPGSKSAKALAEKISQQIVGFQSRIYRQSIEDLEISDRHVEKLEITLFSMSIVTLSVLYFSKQKNKEEDVEISQLDTLKQSLPASGSGVELNTAVKRYQERFSVYQKAYNLFLDSEAVEPEITLGQIVVGYISGGNMDLPPFMATQRVFSAGVLDNIDFAKNVL